MSQSNVAFIGLGIMGAPMASHLLRAGYRLTVHNRTRAKADALVAAGATWADSPADAARASDVIFVNVPDTPDVEKVLLGPGGVIETARPGTIVVDHSTISPTETRRFARELGSRQITLLDAPVSGGDVGARNATLSIMVGGDAQALERVRPLLDRVGKTITYCGPSGSGQVTKLVNQVLVLGTLNAVCEAMAVVRKSGLDPATTLQAVGGGAAKSWQLDNLAPRIAAGDYAPGFMVDLAQKDLKLILDYAAELNLALPQTALVRQLYAAVQSMGGGRLGTQALFRAIEKLNGL